MCRLCEVLNRLVEDTVAYACGASVSEQPYFVLQLQDLGVCLLHLELVWLHLLVVIVIFIIIVEEVISFIQVHRLEHPLKVRDTSRLLERVFNNLNLGSFVRQFLPYCLNLRPQRLNLVFLECSFFSDAGNKAILGPIIVFVDRILLFKHFLNDLGQILLLVNLFVKHSVVLFNLLGVRRQGILLVQT